MSKFKLKEVFSQKNSLLVVVHVTETKLALANIGIALGAGAEGVFLICQDNKSEYLLDFYTKARNAFPCSWIGLNFLDLSAVKALQTLPSSANGLWTDHAGIDLGTDDPTMVARHIRKTQTAMVSHDILHFGGVAFKYHDENIEATEAARLAMPFVDVVTTSGPGTGTPPALEKIQAMRAVMNDFPLAIASGIDVHNVGLFKPYTNYFLVNSSLLVPRSSTHLDPPRVRELAEEIHR